MAPSPINDLILPKVEGIGKISLWIPHHHPDGCQTRSERIEPMYGSGKLVMPNLSWYAVGYKRASTCIPETWRVMFLKVFKVLIGIVPRSPNDEQNWNFCQGSCSHWNGDGNTRIHVVKSEDIGSIRFSIVKIVLPLIGSQAYNSRHFCRRGGPNKKSRWCCCWIHSSSSSYATVALTVRELMKKQLPANIRKISSS